MVTIKTCKGVSAASLAEYFFDLAAQRKIGDYYAGPEGAPAECPGAPLGKLAGSLGMSGDVTVEQLLRLLDGRHPETGVRLRSFRKDRVAAHDITFSAPKSVSVLWALGSDAVVIGVQEAQAAAVAEAVAYLERTVGFVRRYEQGSPVLETADEVLAVAFTHHTSRQSRTQAQLDLPPDPQVHTHVLVPMCRRHDGEIVALNGDPLFKAKQRMDAVYLAALARELAGRGFGIERGTGKGQRYFEVVGIPAGLRDAWSSRTQEIETAQPALIAEFEEKYHRPPNVVELRDLSIRHRLAKGRAHPDPRSFWREPGAEFGVTAATIDTLRTASGALSPEAGRAIVTAELLGPEGLTREHATFDMNALHIAAYVRSAGLLSVAETSRLIDDLTTSGDLVSVGVDRWTTRELLGLEAQVLTWREQVRDHAPPPRPTAAERWMALRAVQQDRDVTLSGEQLDAFRAMLDNRLTAVTGEAGSGKGVVLTAAAHVWRAQGRRVFAVAVAGATAQRLAADLGEGAQAMTLAGLITRLEHGRITLHPDDVIALDEAGMVGTRQWAQFTTAIGHVPTVVALGDEAQLSPLSAGGLWPLIAAGGPRLSGIRRSRLAWERDAWRALRAGDAAEALDGYAAHGQLHVSATRTAALHAAVAAWDADGRTGLLITDASNAERHRANSEAQQHRIAAHELGADMLTITTEHGDVGLRGGDRIIFRAQWRIGHGVRRVENGTTAEVLAVDPAAATVTVRTNEPRPRALTLSAPNAAALIDLGYCAHVYTAQGATVDRAYVIAGGWQTHQENLYVACSRSRLGTSLFADRESLGRLTDPEALAELATRGAASRAKQAARPLPTLAPSRRPPRRGRVLTTRRPLLETYHRRQHLRRVRAAARQEREARAYAAQSRERRARRERRQRHATGVIPAPQPPWLAWAYAALGRSL